MPPPPIHLERKVVVCGVRKGAQHIQTSFGCLPQRLPHYVPALSVACITDSAFCGEGNRKAESCKARDADSVQSILLLAHLGATCQVQRAAPGVLWFVGSTSTLVTRWCALKPAMRNGRQSASNCSTARHGLQGAWFRSCSIRSDPEPVSSVLAGAMQWCYVLPRVLYPTAGRLSVMLQIIAI